jgi:hypothetical protein
MIVSESFLSTTRPAARLQSKARIPSVRLALAGVDEPDLLVLLQQLLDLIGTIATMPTECSDCTKFSGLSPTRDCLGIDPEEGSYF